MKYAKFWIIALLVGLVLSACAPSLPAASVTATSSPVVSAPVTLVPALTDTPAPTQPQSATPSPAVNAARQLLAQQLGTPVDQIKTVAVEKVEWPNGCMGVQMPGKMCTQMVTPGYRIVLEANGKQYEYHTDLVGGVVLLAVSQLPQSSNKVVVWEQTEGGVCSRAEIGMQNVAFGPCNGTLREAGLQPNRAAELTYLLSTYQAFSGGTKAGTISFTGQGQTQPTEAEMRSVAEWAKLVFMEAQGGRGGAAWGLAFAWHREGGIAGFCNDLAVYLNGWAMPSTCKAGQVKSYNEYHLTAGELAQMYTWVDLYKNFDYEMKDAATADAMKITMTFSGAGSADAPADVQQTIAGFAAGIYANAVR